jgi:hypothetical protein
MTDVIYDEYVATFRELRAAVDSNDLLRLREAFLEIADLSGLDRAASDLAVWDAARLRIPRSPAELVAGLVESRASAA